MSVNKKVVQDVPGVTGGKNGSTLIVTPSLVFLSGAVGVDGAGNWVAGTVKDRTRAILQGTQKKLQHIGLDLNDVVAATIYLTDYDRDFKLMNEAYFEAFDNFKPLPTRTCVGVSKLAADTDVEITFTAVNRN